MLSEPPLGATTAGTATELVWLAADPDRAGETRRRGSRCRWIAGLFTSPVSAFEAFFACLLLCLLAIAIVLWIRIALRDAYTTTSPALGARRVATQEGPTTWDSNACRAGEVERKVWRDNDSLLRSLLLKTPQLVIGRFRCVHPLKARGSGAVSLLALEQLSSEVAPTPSSHCVLSRFAQGSSAWCNRGRIAQVPEQLTLNQRVAGLSPAAPTIELSGTLATD